jgi:type I restriction enzyme M protein
MASIEASKPELLGVLPQQEYDRFNRSPQNKAIPKALLKLFSDIPLDAAGDVFGQIYEYFLANFASAKARAAASSSPRARWCG